MRNAKAGEEGTVAVALNEITVFLLFSNNEFQSGCEPSVLACSGLSLIVQKRELIT